MQIDSFVFHYEYGDSPLWASAAGLGNLEQIRQAGLSEQLYFISSFLPLFCIAKKNSKKG